MSGCIPGSLQRRDMRTQAWRATRTCRPRPGGAPMPPPACPAEIGRKTRRPRLCGTAPMRQPAQRRACARPGAVHLRARSLGGERRRRRDGGQGRALPPLQEALVAGDDFAADSGAARPVAAKIALPPPADPASLLGAVDGAGAPDLHFLSHSLEPTEARRVDSLRVTWLIREARRPARLRLFAGAARDVERRAQLLAGGRLGPWAEATPRGSIPRCPPPLRAGSIGPSSHPRRCPPRARPPSPAAAVAGQRAPASSPRCPWCAARPGAAGPASNGASTPPAADPRGS